MPIALDQLPDDIDALKSLVADQVGRNEQLQSKVIILQEQLNLALARRYAASSEKLAPDVGTAAACRAMGVSRATLYRKLKKLGIQ